MTAVIKLKRSETADSVPTTSDLAVGEVAVNTADQKIYIRDSGDNIVQLGGSSSGGSGENVSWAVAQSSHGFSVGDVIYHNGTNYVAARSNVSTTLGVFVVSAVENNNNFTATFSGKIDGLTGLTAGQLYFVSSTTAGDFTSTEPSSGFSNPILFGLSETEAVVLPYRPATIDDSSNTTPVSEGGTGATTASGARTNLDVYSTTEVNAQAMVFGIVLG